MNEHARRWAIVDRDEFFRFARRLIGRGNDIHALLIRSNEEIAIGRDAQFARIRDGRHDADRESGGDFRQFSLRGDGPLRPERSGKCGKGYE